MEDHQRGYNSALEKAVEVIESYRFSDDRIENRELMTGLKEDIDYLKTNYNKMIYASTRVDEWRLKIYTD